MNTPTQNSDSFKERLIGLDLLRGVAVLLVLGHHFSPLDGGSQLPSALQISLEALHRGGWVGVDLFFVLSGFLVSRLLFAEYRKYRTLSVSRFYVRRGWKIYPPFIVLLAATVVLHLYAGLAIDFGALAAEAAFVQNYAPGFWIHTWSLAVEEHFYFLLPLLLLFIVKCRNDAANPFAGWLPATVACCCCVVLMLRFENAARVPEYAHHTHLAPTHLRIDSLLFGVLIGYLYHFHRDGFVRLLAPFRHLLLLAGAVLCFLPFMYPRETNRWTYTIGPTLFYLGAGALLVACLLSRLPRRRLTSGLATIGLYSYSIYLWHMPVMKWIAPKVQSHVPGSSHSAWLQLVLHLGGSVVMGIIMAKVVETPVLMMRDRWFPPPSKQQAPAIAPPPTPGADLIDMVASPHASRS